MGEIVTSRFPEETVKKMDQAVQRGHYKSRSEALRAIVEEYLKEHPQLFIGEGAKKLLTDSPDLSDDELEALGTNLFEDINITKLISEGRGRE